MSNTLKKTPDWEAVLTSASHLQDILPEAVLVGGTAAAIHVGHRTSFDDDHVLTNLRENFQQVLSDLESVAGWKTARKREPILILGSLYGIETGVRQLIRKEPLEIEVVERFGLKITVPTLNEVLRIKSILILKRNATRDYVDFAAMANNIGKSGVIEALRSFDKLYPQDSGQSALQQLLAQLSNAMPYDIDKEKLSEYRHIKPPFNQWETIKDICCKVAVEVYRVFSTSKSLKPQFF